MNILTLDRGFDLRKWVLLAAVTLLMVANCGRGHDLEAPLPTNTTETPLLPGCKQLRAEHGEC